MKEAITSYVGLDIHKDSVAIAIAGAGRTAPHFLGTTPATLAGLAKVLRRNCNASRTLIVYEAGPCGYGWARYLNRQGWPCEVIAPARIARSPAERRIKTDRRDALLLARESRAGRPACALITSPSRLPSMSIEPRSKMPMSASSGSPRRCACRSKAGACGLW
jgi:transposase